jgi:CHASE2 domain-containing sensor protein
MSWISTRLRSRPSGYWIRTAGAILLGLGLGELANERHVGLPWRYEVSRAVQAIQPHEDPRWTTVVLIEDDQYWRGSLARRVPIHRDYLAGLVRAVASCDPSVIALDFNLRSPVVTGCDLRDRYGTVRDNHAYEGETAALAAAIEEVRKDVQHKTKVLLPLTVRPDKTDVEPSVLDGVPSVAGAVARGTIILPWDYRQVLTAETIGGRPVPSFALAAADLARPGLAAQYAPDQYRYDLSFIPPEEFKPLSYREDGGFPTPAECERIRHKVVVVGSAWHSGAYNLGDVIDTRDSTPMGHAVGAVYLWANYIEALLEGRAKPLLPSFVAVAVEVGASIWIALILAGGGHRRLRKYAAAAGIGILLIFLTYICAQNLGLFADFFFPAVIVFLHAWWDDWRELKAAAKLGETATAKLGAAEARLAEAEAQLRRLGA